MGWGEGCIEDIFANAAEHFVQLIPSQVGVYFLGRGTNRRLRAAQQPEAFFVRGDVFSLVQFQMFSFSTSARSTQPSPPNLENGTYVRQQQQIGETYTKHGATVANW